MGVGERRAEDIASEALPLLLADRKMDEGDRAKVEREAPDGPEWGPSPNIGRLTKSALLLDALLRRAMSTVSQGLVWWVWTYSRPFLEVEEMTNHHTYRNWNLLPNHVALGVGTEVGDGEVAHSSRLFLRAAAALLGLAAGTGPCQKIRNHGEVGKTRHVVGDGELVGSVPYVGWAGKRGLVRNRTKVGKKIVLGDFIGLDTGQGGYLLARAARLDRGQRRDNAWAHDFLEAALERWGWMRPFGLTDEESATLRGFTENPTEILLARQLCTWVTAKPELLPKLAFTIGRHVDGSVWMICRKAGKSSTGTLAIVVWHVGGRIDCAGWDAGGRDSGEGDPDVTGGRAWEEERHLVCVSDENGKPEVRVEKPAAALAYRIELGPAGCGVFEADGTPSRDPNEETHDEPGPSSTPAKTKPKDSGKAKKIGYALGAIALAALLWWALS